MVQVARYKIVTLRPTLLGHLVALASKITGFGHENVGLEPWPWITMMTEALLSGRWVSLVLLLLSLFTVGNHANTEITQTVIFVKRDFAKTPCFSKNTVILRFYKNFFGF